MVWYFIVVYILKRTLNGHLEIGIHVTKQVKKITIAMAT